MERKDEVQGIKAETTVKQLSLLEYIGHCGNEAGNKTEEKVAQILEGHPHVTSTRRTELNSADDGKGIDLYVQLEPMEDLPPDFLVYVQVKSSKRTERDFRQGLTRKYGVPQFERDRWLAENRFIVIIGQSDEETITARFDEQLERIRQVHGV